MRDALTAGKPDGPVYEIEVSRSGVPGIRGDKFTEIANARWANGYVMEHLAGSAGSVIVVWRKREP